MKPLILLTNDDGIHAEGILRLRDALQPLGAVTVVAPDRPRSASGHAITLHKPLRVTAAHLMDGSPGLATSGTPSDCVTLGCLDLLPRRPDLVFSGINDGSNLGFDLTYSGTVSAAMEGCIQGVTSVAISLVRPSTLEPNYDEAAQFARTLAERLLEKPLPAHVLLNVNVPQRPEGVAGVRGTHQGVRRYPGEVDKRTDPWGRVYYWLGGSPPEDQMDHGSDVEAVATGFISVMPVHMDLTDSRLLDDLRSWFSG
ncbi:MAG TPA: 5'/3'-nucleotidase SurE [Armatimonadota bacterium]